MAAEPAVESDSGDFITNCISAVSTKLYSILKTNGSYSSSVSVGNGVTATVTRSHIDYGTAPTSASAIQTALTEAVYTNDEELQSLSSETDENIIKVRILPKLIAKIYYYVINTYMPTIPNSTSSPTNLGTTANSTYLSSYALPDFSWSDKTITIADMSGLLTTLCSDIENIKNWTFTTATVSATSSSSCSSSSSSSCSSSSSSSSCSSTSCTSSCSSCSSSWFIAYYNLA